MVHQYLFPHTGTTAFIWFPADMLGQNVQPGGQAIDWVAHIPSWMIKPRGCHHPETPTGIAGDLTLQDQTICHHPLEDKGMCSLHPILAAVSGHLGGKCWYTEKGTAVLLKRKGEHWDEKQINRPVPYCSIPYVKLLSLAIFTSQWHY